MILPFQTKKYFDEPFVQAESFFSSRQAEKESESLIVESPTITGVSAAIIKYTEAFH